MYKGFVFAKYLFICAITLQAKVAVYVHEHTIIQQQEFLSVNSSCIERLNSMENEHFKKSFQNVSARAKMYYLINLSIEQYEDFLNRFSSNKDWKSYWQKVPEDKRLQIPDWSDQKEMIRYTYYNLYNESSREPFSYFIPFLKEKIGSSLSKGVSYWKKKCADRLCASDPDYRITLEILFFLTRLKVLNIKHLD